MKPEHRNLGRVCVSRCRICGAEGSHATFTIHEQMFGMSESFSYVLCPVCEGLQIQDIPADMGKYYEAPYYSHRSRTEPLPSQGLNGRLVRWYCRTAATAGPYSYSRVLRCLLPVPSDWRIIGGYLENSSLVHAREAILDVGCGSSPYRLAAMRRCGFEHVEGIDPFIEADTVYFGVPVWKRRLHQHSGEYGFIMFHHSLEHVVDPVAELSCAAGMLRPRGVCLVRIPVMNTWLWREYGENWVELDAPRHLHMMSVQSIDTLARRTGFRVSKVVFDSEGWEIAVSELLRRGVPSSAGMRLKDHFSAAELLAFEEKARELNRVGDAGRACFYLERM